MLVSKPTNIREAINCIVDLSTHTYAKSLHAIRSPFSPTDLTSIQPHRKRLPKAPDHAQRSPCVRLAVQRTHCPLRTIASRFNCFECDAARRLFVFVPQRTHTAAYHHLLGNIHEMLSEENGTPTTATVNVQERTLLVWF